MLKKPLANAPINAKYQPQAPEKNVLNPLPELVDAIKNIISETRITTPAIIAISASIFFIKE